MSVGNKGYMCEVEEGFVDHISTLCLNKYVVMLVFSIFGISCVIHASTRLMLLSWNGSYVRKRRKRAWKLAHVFILDNLVGATSKGF